MMQKTDFIGYTVYHSGWGEGVIEKFDSSSMVVHFIKTNAGERSVKFQFPKSFADGFLYFTDKALQSDIELLIAECKCVFCDKIGIQTELINGKRVCADCKKEHMTKCPFCSEFHERESMQKCYTNEHSFHSILICDKCAANNTFECERCNKRLHIKYKVISKVSNRTICQKCLPNVVRECHFCKVLFDINQGDTFYDCDEGETVDVCSNCITTHTFKCEECGYEKLTTSRFSSKYIPEDYNICKSCVSSCSICNEKFPDSKIIKSFGKIVCPHCWEKLKKQCSICNDDYISNESLDQLCPDCVESQLYTERLKKTNITKYPFKTLRYWSLEYINRCDLFTNLYEFCEPDLIFGVPVDEGSPFKYIAMEFFNMKIIITHLSRDIVGKVRHSENITMTEFKNNSGRAKVLQAIEQWRKISTSTIDLPIGRMNILNYPILLRVQTKYDKIYGKEWNGPDDYIEIGNYGDTTNFYIIGFVE